MKKRIFAMMISLVMLFALIADLAGLAVRAEAYTASALASKTEKKGIVVENVAVEMVTSNQVIAWVEKELGRELDACDIVLKTTIYARSYFANTIYDPVFFLDYHVFEPEFDIAYIDNDDERCMVNQIDVTGDAASVKKGQAFTATVYHVVGDPERLCQSVHVSEVYFKDSKNAAGWICAVPTESAYYSFKDYEKALNILWPDRDAALRVGDVVRFGSYEQDNKTKSKESIEWIVLETDGDKALLLSRYCLDSVPFNNVQEEIKWEDCTLRKWLNTTFLQTAFSSTEQRSLILSTITNDSNPTYGTSGGGDTEDKVFLLSIEEVETYFGSDSARKVKATPYAKKQGAQVYGSDTWWRLRSPGKFDYSVASVYASGKIAYKGDTVHDTGCAIRPAIWVKMS